MGISIHTVGTKRDLKRFVKFPFKLYRGDPFWIPQLIRDEMQTFNRNKNPAFENSDCRLFMAYRDGKPVGRIAAVLSHVANKKYNTKNMRFGWFDTVDDPQVAAALFGAVEAWARELGLETITGPHGFCDLDLQGMLVEGFDQMPTIAGYYNYPYYPKLVEGCGFRKDIDYLEFKAQVPAKGAFPEKLIKLAERVAERGGFRILKFKNMKEIKGRAIELFELLDEAYEEIYGSVPLTDRQKHYYIKKYISFVDKDLVPVVVNQRNEMIGFMISMPNLSRAFQKARGRLLPFGWFHLWRGLKQNKIIDFYLAGIKKTYRGQGIDLLMVVEVARAARAKGFDITESNQELETNTKIQAQWKYFNPVQHKRKRIYKKSITT